MFSLVETATSLVLKVRLIDLLGQLSKAWTPALLQTQIICLYEMESDHLEEGRPYSTVSGLQFWLWRRANLGLVQTVIYYRGTQCN